MKNFWNTAGIIVLGLIALPYLQKLFPAARQPAGSSLTTPSGMKLIATDLPPTTSGAQIFLDDSGDLVTINSTGGVTALPDPNGIGGGFAT